MCYNIHYSYELNPHHVVNTVDYHSYRYHGATTMTWARFLIVILVLIIAHALTGCAVYSVANTVTYIATDKSLTDHTSSKLATADCDAVRMAVNGTYYCEVRDISVTYNRNTF